MANPSMFVTWQHVVDLAKAVAIDKTSPLVVSDVTLLTADVTDFVVEPLRSIAQEARLAASTY